VKQPVFTYTGYATFDLTEGKVHKLTRQDGTTRFVALFPKAWEKAGEKMVMMTINGPIEMQQYRVTEWEEHQLQPA
jgi:hypothetical protein